MSTGDCAGPSASTAKARGGKKIGKKKWAIEVDERTAAMSQPALECRAMNHAWHSVRLSVARRLELLKLGQTERVRECQRCDTTRTTRRQLPSYDVLSDAYHYPDTSYLVPKGSGRLSAAEADKALLVQEMAGE